MNLINTITYINIYLSVLLALFFVFNKKGNRRTNILLSVSLFIFSTLILFTFSVSKYAAEIFMPYHKLFFVMYQAAFLIGPIVYIYSIVALTNGRLSVLHLLHSIPFILGVIFAVIINSKTETFVLWEQKVFYDTIVRIFIHMFIYLGLTVYLIFKKVSISKELPRFIKSIEQFGKCKLVLLCYVYIWTVCLHSLAMYMMYINADYCAYTSSIWNLPTFLVITILIIAVIYNPRLLFRINKYKYSDLNSENKNSYIAKIEDYFTESKTYLEPDLSLDKVSEDLCINKRHLSQIINETYQLNFRNYLNQLRLNYSINLIEKDNTNTMRISEIMLDSGFSSKTIFNSMFKKETGMTPKEYRSRQKKRP